MPERLAPCGAAPVADGGGRSGTGLGAGQPAAGAARASGAAWCRQPWGHGGLVMVPLPLKNVDIGYHYTLDMI